MKILLTLLLLITFNVQAAERVSVNDLRADPTGQFDSHHAFAMAHRIAGIGGVITCDPGTYILDKVWWIWNPGIKIECPGAILVAGPGVLNIIKVIQIDPQTEVRLIRMRLAGLDGSNNGGNCLSVVDANFSHFQIDHIHHCGVGVLIRPRITRVADNTFQGLLWEFNGTAIKMRCGGHHVQSNRFDVNFVANNKVGIDIEEDDPCASMFWFRGSLDQFSRGVDGWVRAPNSLVETSFLTRNGRHLRTSPTTYLHALDLNNNHILKTGTDDDTLTPTCGIFCRGEDRGP